MGLTSLDALVLSPHLSYSPPRSSITGCLGGVGRSAVRIACMRGANIVGSCSASGREEALALGVSEVVGDRAFDVGSYRNGLELVFNTAGVLSLEPVWRDTETRRGCPCTSSNLPR